MYEWKKKIEKYFKNLTEIENVMSQEIGSCLDIDLHYLIIC